MLIAELAGVRVEAAEVQRGPVYVCPQCKGVLILKQGRKVIWHFAHKPPTDCTWATGETIAHLEAKKLVRDSMVARGLRAEIEYIVATLPRDRRADVMVWSPNGEQLAIELQHTSIDLDEIEERAGSYARAGIAQMWIPFLSKSAMLDAEPRGAGCIFIETYSARPFERWVHGLHGFGGMWMYSANDKTFWHGSLKGHQIWVEETSWFEAGGVERTEGGYYRWSKRYRELTLSGPRGIDRLLISIKSRGAYSQATYNWPACRLASFVPAA
jgi:Competence protein CoiA-like family